MSVDVIDANVPFLLGLEKIEKCNMVLDTDRCVFSARLRGYEVPLRMKLVHIYYE